MATRDPSAAATKWKNRLTTAATDGTIAAGIDSVTVSPGQAAARQADVWLANTTAAKARFQANSARVDVNAWKDAAKTKGLNRIADGATAGESKMASSMAKLLPAIDSLKGSLPARGSFAQNMQRAQQMAAGLHDKKGSFKA